MDDPNYRYKLWCNYTKNLSAPQVYIDLSYYWLISTCLQRRIFLQSYERPLFPNLYVVLVGPPGIGKGIVITPIAEILKAHKLHKKTAATPAAFGQLDEAGKRLLAIKMDLEEAIEKNMQASKIEEPMLFPVAPDDITYEKLVEKTAQSIRRIRISEPNQMAPSGYYGHCSIAVCLEEMATLFKRNSEKVLKFLLKAFDSGDYTYETISRGQSKIKNNCLSLLAGTTPGQIKEMLDERIVDDGWSGRTIFVYADRPRRYTFGIADFSPAQLEAKQLLIKHVGDLGALYGLVKYSPEAYDFLVDYFVTSWEKVEKNKDIRLFPYYQRKNIHVPKLALAVHFSEVEILYRDGKPICDMTLNLWDVKRALELTESIEPKMHLALNFKKRNPLAEASDAIIELLKSRGELTRVEILQATWDQLPNGEESLDQVLVFLQSTERILGKPRPVDGRNVHHYTLTEKYLTTGESKELEEEEA